MSSAARKGARATAAAFAVGLSLSAPALATADTGDTGDTDTASAARSAEQADRPGNLTAQPARSTRESGHRADRSDRADRAESPLPGASATPVVLEASPTPRGTGSDGRTPRPTARRAAADPVLPPSTPGLRVRGIATTDTPRRLAASTAPDRTADAAVTVTTETDGSIAPALVPTPPAPGPLEQTAITAPAGLAVAAVPAAAAATDWFSGLLAPVQAFVEGIALLIRRTFFNQAPTVAPVQTTGQLLGPITGTVGAIDPEDDPLTYEVTVAPRYGSVEINADGDYVYTPGTDFTGLDSFNVAVTDTGFHVNLFDPTRPASTEAFLQVTQNATAPMLTFSFIYGSGSQFWSSEARGALQDAAMQLAMYVAVDTPTTMVYRVTGENDPISSTLASAGSDMVEPGAGFFATVVQQKIQSGVDANGSQADGDIAFNFGNPWALGTSVGTNQYDFTSTAMHELLHTFGFLSYTEEPGLNSARSWTTFDRFLVTADGTNVITNNYRWITAYDDNLIGGGGGLYFGGPNAVAAYGGLIPLYTPDPWEWGSSVSHLDDYTFTGADTMLMNAVTETGLGVRVLSPIELAILKDLGYTVYESGPLQALVLIGFGFLRRRRGDHRPVS
ncbi:MAG TPA: Ig-like domain-containing protein [Mycobacterium sp.]|nr:Ig-like domain-containing protein [Mycobacterium sp.]